MSQRAETVVGLHAQVVRRAAHTHEGMELGGCRRLSQESRSQRRGRGVDQGRPPSGSLGCRGPSAVVFCWVGLGGRMASWLVGSSPIAHALDTDDTNLQRGLEDVTPAVPAPGRRLPGPPDRLPCSRAQSAPQRQAWQHSHSAAPRCRRALDELHGCIRRRSPPLSTSGQHSRHVPRVFRLRALPAAAQLV